MAGVVISQAAERLPQRVGRLVYVAAYLPREPVRLTQAGWGRVPKLYVHTRQDQAVSYPLQQATVVQAGPDLPTVTLDSAHSPMLSQPHALADVIAQAAR